MGRVDGELVRAGFARSRAQAVTLVREGRVTIDGVAATKPSVSVEEHQELAVRPDPDDPGYASRAGFKLAGVLDALASVGGPDPDGLSCLDLGASTGGFTDVLLRRGARHVLAVDVGHDQLVDRIRVDPRVSVREGLNVRDLTDADIPAPPGLVVADLSFVSLTLALPPLALLLDERTELIVLVKPQFEVGRSRLGSGGVVRDPELRAEAIRSVADCAVRCGLVPRAVVPSPLPGPSGNREYFWWMSAKTGMAADAIVEAATRAVAWDPPADGGLVPPVCWACVQLSSKGES